MSEIMMLFPELITSTFIPKRAGLKPMGRIKFVNKITSFKKRFIYSEKFRLLFFETFQNLYKDSPWLPKPVSCYESVIPLIHDQIKNFVPTELDVIFSLLHAQTTGKLALLSNSNSNIFCVKDDFHDNQIISVDKIHNSDLFKGYWSLDVIANQNYYIPHESRVFISEMPFSCF